MSSLKKPRQLQPTLYIDSTTTHQSTERTLSRRGVASGVGLTEQGAGKILFSLEMRSDGLGVSALLTLLAGLSTLAMGAMCTAAASSSASASSSSSGKKKEVVRLRGTGVRSSTEHSSMPRSVLARCLLRWALRSTSSITATQARFQMTKPEATVVADKQNIAAQEREMSAFSSVELHSSDPTRSAPRRFEQIEQ
eukprot:18369-Heterococcus_DN1.PRE.1